MSRTRTREEIERLLEHLPTTTDVLQIELLLDIRDYLQRIDLEMPTEPVDTYVKTR